MIALKKFFAPALLGTAMALSATSAFALNEGDGNGVTYTEMQAKLANEQQVEILTASTGSAQNVRGVKLYYNQVTKIGYVVLTDNYAAPTAMRIVRKTTGTDFNGPVIVPQPIQGVEECKKIVSEKPGKAKDCISLYSRLKGAQDDGFSFFQQGKMDNGSNMIIVMNSEQNQAKIFESTPNGATLTMLLLASASPTPEGQRMLASLAPRKIASADQLPKSILK